MEIPLSKLGGGAWKLENARSEQSERREQGQQHTELCVFRGKLAGLCPGRETLSGTKGRARSGEIMLIVCTRAGERHPKWREKGEPCPEPPGPCASLLLSTCFSSSQVGDQKGLEKRSWGFWRRGRGRTEPEYLQGWRRGESTMTVGRSQWIKKSQCWIYLFIPCASCLAPGPLPQRLHDFGAPTAVSTLDGRHPATSYGMTC